MRQNYRHLSESSDGSGNSKSAQPTTLSSINGLGNTDRQLTTVNEKEDNHDDFEYADQDVDEDKERHLQCSGKMASIPTTCCECNTFPTEKSTEAPRYHREGPRKDSQSVKSKTMACSESLGNIHLTAETRYDTNGLAINDNALANNSKYSIPTNETSSDKNHSKTNTADKSHEHKSVDKRNNKQTNKFQNVRDTYTLSPDEKKSYDVCSTWNNASPDTCVDIDEDLLSTSSNSRYQCIENVQQRDRNIHEYQYGNNMMQTLESRYRSMMDDMTRKQELLKAGLLWLTVMFIVIILCVAVSMIYSVTRNMSHIGVGEVEALVPQYLSSPEVRDELRSQVLCVECADVSADVLSLFIRDEDDECCIQDMAIFSFHMKELFSKDSQTQNNRLRNVEKTLYELEQEAQFQSVILNVGEKNESGDTDKFGEILENTFSKIQNNERMINALLERRRSALQLVGRVESGKLQWQYKAGDIEPIETSSSVTISVRGGTYFVYCTMQFYCDQMQTDGQVIAAYSLELKGKRGGPQTIATVQHDCTNGSSTEKDLMLHQIISVPVNQDKTITLNVKSRHVSRTHDHSFGIFEI